MTQQPDPDFVEFFAGEWQRLLGAVQIPGMPDASWDRKAAWLLWLERNPLRAFPNMLTPVKTVTTNVTPQPKMPWET